MHRRYTESGDGWKLTATRRGYSDARYTVEAARTRPAKAKPGCDRWGANRLVEAIQRAKTAMGES